MPEAGIASKKSVFSRFFTLKNKQAKTPARLRSQSGREAIPKGMDDDEGP